MGNRPQLPNQVIPTEFEIEPALPHQLGGAGVWALPVLPGDTDGDSVLLGPGAVEVGESLGLDLVALAEALGATGATGEVHSVPVAGEVSLVLLVGVGDAAPTDLRRAGAALARAVKGRDLVVTTLGMLSGSAVEAVVVGAMLGSFEFHWRSQGPKETPVARMVLAGLADSDSAAGLARGVALGRAGWRSRHLATVPSNLKNPEWLAQAAAEIAEESGLDLTIWDEDRLAAEGFGGILAVGSGSVSAPRMIRLDYAPPGADESTETVALVGKGITFDTGGLSIKPADSMLTMKRDMSGAAAVLATMAALRDVSCPVRVVGLVPAAENAVSGSSMRPGDVITHYGGRTSEVNNTDAEGRLVLADAMAYAAAEVKPAVIVDVATLTGAMKVALGLETAGYFSTSDALAAAVETAAEASGERVWRMPLAEEYADKVTSKTADLDNAAGGPGAITAALFLKPFADGLPWVHVDFASVAEAPKDKHEWTAGPTGWGPRLLLNWLGSPAPLEGIG